MQHPFVNHNTTPTQGFSGLVVGAVLGDGHINRHGTITIDHAEAQRSYVEWKHQGFRDLNVLAPGSKISQVVRLDKRTGTRTHSCRFFTRSLYKRERQLFYPEGKKRVPPKLADMLDPLGLAVWFMDDGGRGGNTKYGLVIDVSSFTREEQSLLQDVLLAKFHLQTSLQSHGSSLTGRPTTKIYIKRASGLDFYAIVDPYIIPSMRWKLDAYDQDKSFVNTGSGAASIDPVTTEEM